MISPSVCLNESDITVSVSVSLPFCFLLHDWVAVSITVSICCVRQQLIKTSRILPVILRKNLQGIARFADFEQECSIYALSQ